MARSPAWMGSLLFAAIVFISVVEIVTNPDFEYGISVLGLGLAMLFACVFAFIVSRRA